MKNRSAFEARKSIFYDFTACFLIILSHFTNYIIYAGYDRIFPDIVSIVGLLCIVAAALTLLLQIRSSIFRAAIYAVLITIVLSDAVFEFGVADLSIRLLAMSATLIAALGLVFFLRAHASFVIAGTFLAMLFSTVVIEAVEPSDRSSAVDANATAGDPTLPVIVHLILDEHIGLAGLTPLLPGGETVRRDLRRFFEGSGFRIFSHAYSQYFETAPSLASAMNLDSNGDSQKFLTQRLYGFSLDQNAYLKKIAAPDYTVNVYQSNYFDLCASSEIETRICETYKPDHIAAPEIRNLPLAERIRLIVNMYYSSFALIKIAKLIDRPVNDWLDRNGIGRVHLGLWHGRVGPIAIASTLTRLKMDLSRAKGGTVFFAHLLTPHYPYVYTPDCMIRAPVSSWSLRWRDAGTNTAASRRQRYGEYFDQVRCTMRKLEDLFEAMKRGGTYKDAIIVIHGDHGSRISKAEPSAKTMPEMTVDDHMDGFSTLFVLKAPGISPGVDPRMLPLSQLLAYAATRDDRNLAEPSRHTVFVENGPSDFTEIPLAEFPPLAD